MIAVEQKWPLRIRWVRDEFGIGEATSVNTTGARTTIR